MYFENNTVLQPHSMLRAPVVCGFTTREAGDMTNREKREAFVKTIRFHPDAVYWQHQTHGSSVTVLTGNDQHVVESDASILPYGENTAGKLLTVHTADCVPILFWDQKTGMIAVAHSGWKGTLGGMCGNTIRTMAQCGALPSSIHVVIGPHIRPCCYDVDPSRVELFSKRFGSASLGTTTDGKASIDLLNAIVSDALTNGISGHAIDISCVSCTKCHPDEFFSYRRDNGKLTGEILGYIGYNTNYHGPTP